MNFGIMRSDRCEKMFVNLCYSRPEYVKRNIGELSEICFTLPEVKSIFEITKNAVEANQEFNLLMFAQKGIDDVFLTDCSLMEGTNNPDFIFQELQRYAKIRALGKELLTYNEKMTDENAFEDLQQRILNIKIGQDNSEVYNMNDLSSRAVSRWEKNLNDRKRFFFDIPKIKDCLVLRPGNILYVIAPPKTGKTWLLSLMVSQLSDNGNRVFFVSAEMHPDELYQRILSYRTNRDFSNIDNPEGSDIRREQLMNTFSDTVGSISTMQVRIAKAIGINGGQLYSLLLKAKYEKSDVVVLDYLQRIHVPDAKDLRIATAQISAMLTDFAKQNNILLIVASQANRQAYAIKGQATEAHHAKESGNIEADADAIITMADTTDYSKWDDCPKHKTTFKVVQRNGQSGIFSLYANRSTGRYEE